MPNQILQSPNQSILHVIKKNNSSLNHLLTLADFTLKRSDQIDSLIASKFSKMAASRAQAFEIMRRKALKDYDITLLITNEILQKYNSTFIIELILSLIGTLEKDLLQIKLNINTQCRIAATYFMQQLANPANQEFW